MKNFETKEECEKYIVAEYGECAFQVGVIFAYRVKPIEAKCLVWLKVLICPVMNLMKQQVTVVNELYSKMPS